MGLGVHLVDGDATTLRHEGIRVVGIIAGLGCDEDGGDEEAVDVVDGHGERRTSARHQTPDVGDGDQEADGVKLCVPAEADEIAVHGHVGDGDGVEAGGSAARMREGEMEGRYVRAGAVGGSGMEERSGVGGRPPATMSQAVDRIGEHWARGRAVRDEI